MPRHLPALTATRIAPPAPPACARSIFGFRGAAPAIFEHALRSLPGGAPAVRSLATNYRSSRNIVAVAICILEPEAATVGVQAVAARRAQAGALAGAALAMRTDNAQGAPVEVVEARVVETEADFIAGRLHALRAGGRALEQLQPHHHHQEARAAGEAAAEGGGAAAALHGPGERAVGRPCAWGEMAVLHRTNKEGAELCALLRARGVPAVQRGFSAFAGEAARTLLAALRCAVSAADDGAFSALAEAMGVPPAAMHALRSHGNGSRLLDVARRAYSASSAGAPVMAAAPRTGVQQQPTLPQFSESDRPALGRLLRAVDTIRSEARHGDLRALADAAVKAGVLDSADAGAAPSASPAMPGQAGADARRAGGERNEGSGRQGGGGSASGGPGRRGELSAEQRSRRAAQAAAALAAEAEAFLAAEAEEEEAELRAAAVSAANGSAGQPARPRARHGGLDALRRFLAHTALCEDECSATKGSTDTLAVLTIHAAKGLEFEHVLIARVNEDCLPLASSRAVAGDGDLPSGHIEEERRLAYVAATRARKSLAISYVKQLDGGPMHRSRFLDGVVKLPPAVVRRSEAYEPRPADCWPKIVRALPGPAARRAPSGGGGRPLPHRSWS